MSYFLSQEKNCKKFNVYHEMRQRGYNFASETGERIFLLLRNKIAHAVCKFVSESKKIRYEDYRRI